MPDNIDLDESWAKSMRDPSLDLAYKMRLVTFDVDAAKDMQEAILNRINNATGMKQQLLIQAFERYERAYFSALVKDVSDATGADPKQIADKNTRTPEQQQALVEASARRQIAQIEKYLDSNHAHALAIIQNVKSIFDPDPQDQDPLIDPDDPDPWSFKESFLWYWFTTRPDLRPSATDSLTDQDRDEILATFKRFDSFIAKYFGDVEAAKHCSDKEYLAAIEAFITEENPNSAKAVIKQIKKMPSLKPKNFVFINNPLMNALQMSGTINNPDGFDLEVFREGKPNAVKIYTLISYEPSETDTTITDPKFTEYERLVSDAIISIWQDANKKGVDPAFTIDTIYNTLPGGGDKASPKQREEIARVIEKCRRTRIKIDATNELRARGVIDDDERYTENEDYFLLREARLESPHSNRSVNAYILTAKPVMLRYAEKTNQLISVQKRLLDIRKVKKGAISTELVAMTSDRQAITGYMARRILWMKRDLEAAREKLKKYNSRRHKHPEEELPEKKLSDFRKQSSTILYGTLFAATDTATDNREQTRRNREFCLDVLEYWLKDGWIQGYTQLQKGNKFTGISIELLSQDSESL